MTHGNREHAIRAIRGFTLIEMIMSITVSGILFGVGFASMRDYGRKQRAQRAAQAMAWSVTLARSSAIRSGAQIILAFDETRHTVVLKDTAGAVLTKRSFGKGSEFVVRRMDLDLDGDSLVFTSRGMCLNCRLDQATQVFVESGDKKYTLEVGLLGRTEVKRRQ